MTRFIGINYVHSVARFEFRAIFLNIYHGGFNFFNFLIYFKNGPVVSRDPTRRHDCGSPTLRLQLSAVQCPVIFACFYYIIYIVLYKYITTTVCLRNDIIKFNNNILYDNSCSCSQLQDISSAFVLRKTYIYIYIYEC